MSEKAKYTENGLIRFEAILGRVGNEATAQNITNKANFGLSHNTWKSYGSSINNLKRCQEDTGEDMSLPFDDNKTLKFVGWMLNKKFKSRTMSSYLSGIRMYHISCGFKEPCLREPIIQMVLKGQDNWDNIQERINGTIGRLPVTITVMKLLKANLIKENWTILEKRLFWAVACLAWSGSFRIHELLSKNKGEMCEQTTLQWQDIEMNTLDVEGKMLETITVFVKSPKVDRIGAGDKIEVIQLDNTG